MRSCLASTARPVAHQPSGSCLQSSQSSIRSFQGKTSVLVLAVADPGRLSGYPRGPQRIWLRNN